MTGNASIDGAVECMRHGAFDYLTKPFDDLRRVRETVRRALARRRLAGHGTGAEPMPEGAGEAGRRLGESILAAPKEVPGGRGCGPVEIPLSLDAYEKSALERALRESAGDAGLAARRLGIGRSTFYRKLARHGIGEGRGAGRPRGPGRGGVGSHSLIG
jgi:DNA-binding NtrC family response regulator